MLSSLYTFSFSVLRLGPLSSTPEWERRTEALIVNMEKLTLFHAGGEEAGGGEVIPRGGWREEARRTVKCDTPVGQRAAACRE